MEDSEGRFVKTLYVSGFAGYVGDKQVTLRLWAESSNFETDAKTGASIDVGNHLFIWDLTDGEGRRVRDGEYEVRVETLFWPSMQYETASARIRVGEGPSSSVADDGRLIPYLKVEYVED